MKTFHRLLPAVAAFALAACQAPEPQALPLGHSRAPLFTNGGFENSTAFAPDWTVNTYLNAAGLQNPPWPPGTVANLQLSPGGNNLSAVVSNPVPESQLFAGMVAAPGVPRWPKFGTNSAAINQQGFNQNVNSILQSYTTTSADVDPGDNQIHVRFVLAPALQAAGHVQEQQPYFFVSLRNLTAPRAGDLFSSFNFSNSPGTPWQSQGTGGNAVLYTDWTIFDLAPGNTALQVGDTIEIEVFAAGCQPGGHWGEVYVDGFGAQFPGLSIHKTAPTQVNVDSDLTYVFTVENNTTGAVPDAVADEVLPPNTTFVSSTAPAGVTCTTPAVGATGTVTCKFGWMNAGASQTFTVTVHAWAPGAGGKGTASAGTATTLSDATQAWAANAFRGYTVFITGGTGIGQSREIGSNTATQLTVANTWTTTPDATSTYAIVNPPATSGTATAVGGSTLTDNTKAWSSNQWSGYTVTIVAGTGVGQSRQVAGNNATRLTVTTAWTTPLDTTSVYEVKRPPTVNNGNYGVASSTISRLLGQGVTTNITAGVGYADLGLTKTDGVAAVAWGSPVTYTITVTNYGPSAVANAQVVDTFQAPLAANPTWTCAATAGSSCVTASGTGTISNGVNLAVGGVATFTVTGAVVAGSGTSTLSNTATVTAPAGLIDNIPTNNSDTDVDAVGTLVALTLNKVAGATGQGTVTSSPLAISCGPGCASQSASYITGQSVTLTSVARGGDTFLGWGGACAPAGTAPTCTLTIGGATTVTVNYTGPTITGTVSGGNGSVVCSPANLAQGGTSTCSFTPSAGFAIGTVTDNTVDVSASVANGAYVLSNVNQDHAVVVTYAPLPQTPVLTAPANGSTLAASSVTLSGTTSAVAGLTVTVRVDGATVCTATTTAAGAFSCVGSGLADGPHVATAAATNANGTSADSAPVRFTVATRAPVTPVVVGPANGSVVSTATPTVTGTGEPGSTITVRVDGVAVAGAPVVAANGTWSLVLPVALTNGAHTVSAIAKDAVGNTSLSSNVNTFTVDTTAGAPVLTAPADASVVATTTPALSGTAPAGVTVTVLVDGVPACSAVATAGGAFSCTSPALSNGAHQAVASIPAGGGAVRLSNTSTFTVDTLVPAAPVVLAPANGSSTTSTSPAVSGTAEPLATVTVFVDGAVVGTTSADLFGRFSFAVAGPLALGAHTAAATATDAAGHVSPSSAVNSFTVVATTGAVVFLSPPNGSIVATATPLLFGTSAAFASIQVRVDGAVVCSTFATVGGTWSCTPSPALSQGAHLGNANVTGNATPSNTNAFTVDSLVPAAPVVVSPANGATAGPRPTLSGTAEAGTTVTVRLDGVATCVTVASASGAWSCVSSTTLLAGAHTVNATATDAAGNVSAASSTNTFTVDAVAPLAPVVSAPANGSLTSNTKPTVSGTAEANSTVTVYIDGLPVGTAVASAAGAFSFTLTTALVDGLHFVRATATDAAGNVSPSSATNSFTVDSTPPAPPVVSTPANGSVTGNNKPVVSGTAEANSTVSVYLDGVLAGTTTASAAGAWSFTPASVLADGSHTARATATDAAGNVSASSATNTFIVDTTPPAAPVVSAPANGSATNNTKPPVSGTAEANATVSVYFDGVLAGTTTANGAGAWTFTPTTALSQASHTVRATATDAAGNVSPTSLTNTFTVDTTPPAAPVVSAPANGSFTNNPKPPVSGTAEANATVSVYLDGVLAGTTTAGATGAWTFTPPSALSQASHTVRATATDAAGNVSPTSATNTFTVDTTPPAAPVVSAPANGSATNNASPAVSGSAEPGATVSVYLDGVLAGTATANGAGAWTFTPPTTLAQGTHTVRATATDAAGNVSASSATNSFTVDLTPPAAPVLTTPAQGAYTTATPAFSGTAEANSTVTVLVDGAPIGTTTANAAGSWSFTPATALAAGAHTASAKATDAAGNVSPVSNVNAFTVRSAVPAAPMLTAPVNGSTSNVTTTAFTGTAEAGSTVSVRVDGVVVCTALATSAGAFSCTASSALAAGPHVATASAVNVVGSSPESAPVRFTIDTTPPLTPVVLSPANGSRVSTTTPAIVGTGEPGTIVNVRVDGASIGTATVAANGTWSLTPATPLTTGAHTVSATATDAAGNASLASNTNSFTVDTSATGTPVLTAPANGASLATTTPTFSGTAAANAAVTVRVDGAVSCTTTATAGGSFTCVAGIALATGAHTAVATAPDGAGGLLTSNTASFRIDTAAPATPVVLTPANGSTTTNVKPTVLGTAEPFATVLVSIDGTVAGTATADATGAWTFSPTVALASGTHTVSAQARNAAGNTSGSSTPNSFTVTPATSSVVLLSPVDGSITSNPKPSISGTASAGASVDARVDGVVVCTATATASGSWVCTPSTALANGAHLATANVTGSAALSNTNAFIVDTTAPVAPVVLKPANGSTTGPTPLLSGTAEAGARVTVSLDGAVACVTSADATGAWSCTSGTSLTAGSHTVSATATDRAGNASPASATNTFTVVVGTPSVPTLTSPANGSSTNSTSPTFSGTAAAGSTVTVTVDGATVCTTTATSSGTFTCTPSSALAAGAHVALASASNVNGTSRTSAPVSFSIHTTAPATPVVVGPANGSQITDRQPTFTGLGEPGTTITVSLMGLAAGTTTVSANGTWSVPWSAPLMFLAFNVPYTISAVATDAAGNVSQKSNSNTFTVVGPLNFPVVTTPADNSFISTATPALSGTAPASSTVSVRIDGAIVCTATASNAGAFTCTPSTALSQGPHALTATIPDGSGGTRSSNTNTFTVDTSTPPAPVITSPPNGSTIANVLPVIRGTALPFASVAVSIDGAPAGTATADASGVFTLQTTSALAVGSHQVNATQTDRAGKTSASSATNTFTITASSSSIVLLTPVDGSVSSATKPVLSGTATPGLDVQAKVDGAVVCTATVSASGSWSCTPATALADGVHIASASPVGAPFTSNSTSFTVDTAAPAAPTVTAPANGSTTGPTPTLAGTAEARARVTASIDGTASCVAIANASGAWSCQVPSPLSAGTHTVSAVAVDAAGNTSPTSSTNTFTVLTSVPGVPVLNVPAQGSLTNASTPAYSGTAAPGSTVTVRVDGQVVCTATATSAGTFSCTPTTALPDGPHVVTVSASNVQGTSLESPPTTFTVDTQPPASPVIVGPANGSQTTSATPTVTGTGEPGSTVTITIDGTVAGTATVGANGTFTFTVPSTLPPGAHTVSATATDPAGNRSPPSNTSTFTVDPAGATNPVLLAPADNGVVSNASPALSGTAPAGASVTVLVDGTIACVTTATSSGTFSCTPGAPLASGRHRAVATTSGGDAGTLVSNTNTFDVDLAAPQAPVVTSPKDGATTDAKPVILGTAEPLSTVSITIDGTVVGTATADANGRFSFPLTSPLSDGAHTVSAKATDRAGNVSLASATNTFTVVTSTGAGVVLLTPPNGALIAQSKPSLSGTTTPGAQVEARVDGAVVCTATATASGAWTCTPSAPLADGVHLATANLLGSTTASNTNAFTIDTQAPAAPVITRPTANGSAGATPVLAGTAEPGTRVRVSIDGNTVCVADTDAQGNWTCTPGQALTPGTHTVSAVATDAAGNTSQPSTPVTFTVDTTPPAAPVLTSPADGSSTQETKPAFTGTAEANAQVTVSVDGKPVCSATASAAGAFTCTPAAPLTVGAHSANAVATDAAGNVSPGSNTNAFTVTPGPATITAPAGGGTLNTGTPTFTGTAPPNSTVTVTDGTKTVCTATADAMGNWSCTPSTALSEGSHSVVATARVNGQAGPSSASVAFTVDTVAPVVTLSGGPGSETTSADAHFTASANEPNVTFQCSVDGAAFTPCTPAIDLTGLSVGAHTLVVRGTDAAGNTGTAEADWTVTQAKPGVTGTFVGGGCGCTSVDGSALMLFGALALALRIRRRARRG